MSRIATIACARFQARQEALRSQCEEVRARSTDAVSCLRRVNAVLSIQGSPRAWI